MGSGSFRESFVERPRNVFVDDGFDQRYTADVNGRRTFHAARHRRLAILIDEGVEFRVRQRIDNAFLIEVVAVREIDQPAVQVADVNVVLLGEKFAADGDAGSVILVPDPARGNGGRAGPIVLCPKESRGG